MYHNHFYLIDFPTLVAVGFVLGLITFLLIGMFSATPDPYGCTQCDPFLPGYDGPPPIYIEPDFGYDGYYDDPLLIMMVSMGLATMLSASLRNVFHMELVVGNGTRDPVLIKTIDGLLWFLSFLELAT